MSHRYRQRPYVPAKDPLSAIPPSRHPFQFWVMGGMVLSGVSNFVAPGSEVLQQGLDPFFHKVWALTLLVSAVVALVAAFWRDRITGLLMERVGLIGLGFSSVIYAVIAGMTAEPDVVMGLSIVASIGIASLWRAIHVQRELKILRSFVSTHYNNGGSSG